MKKINTFKKVTAAALSTAMLLVPAMTSFAADPTTTAATGNILDYKIVTDVVPTAIKAAINPNGFTVNLRYNKLASDATFSSTEKYYKLEGSTYSVDTSVTSENFGSKKASLYTAETSKAQIVSFNYGLANKSTVDRKITVKLDVTADSNITFVDSAAKATKQTDANDEVGAKNGEYKVFLQLVPAKDGETITTDTYAKATEFAANTTYYKVDNGEYVEEDVADAEAFAALDHTVYTTTTTIGTEIKASELGDVTMQASTAPITFAAGSGTSNADVAYKLGKATYNLKADQFIDLSTSSTGLSDKFEMTAIGGISGFTITGTMNTNTEWSQLTTKTITITPTYKFEDATGLETAVSTGLNQVEADARNYTVTYNAGYGETPATATETVTAGEHPTGTSEDVVALKTREGYTFAGWFTAKDDGDEVTIGDISAATVVYAHWTLADKAPSIATTAYTLTADTPVEVTVDLGAGDKKATSVSAVMFGSANTLSNGYATYENGVITFTTNCVNNLLGRSNASFELVVKFNDTDNTEVTITLSK